jgi:SAM-dependent methyltransferase
MRWEAKATIQAALSRVPLGHAIHRRLQDVARSARIDPESDYARRAKFLRLLREHDLKIEGRAFLEVGTGWHPILPLILHIMGASRIITVDLNRWLTVGSLLETLRFIERCAGRFADDFGVSARRCGETVKRLEGALNEYSLEEVLLSAGVEYRCRTDAADTRLASAELDYVVSTNVLEHVPPQTIDRMLAESVRILKPGGFIVHHIDPRDHFSYDRRITTINFLRFSPRAWYYIGGSGLAYHNRLRCVDYVRLVQRHGFIIIAQPTQLDRRAFEELTAGRIRPHRTFAQYTSEQLCECSIAIVAAAPGAVMPAPSPRAEVFPTKFCR